MRTSIIAAIGAAGLALAGPASAAWDAKDIAAIVKWPTTLRQAVSAAEHNAKGKAFQATSNVSGGTADYVINVLAGDKLITVKVDPKTGKVASSVPDTADQPSDYAAFLKQTPTLDTAIKTAEDTAKGKAIGATYKTGTTTLFRIDIAKKDGSRRSVELDGKTGKILKVSWLGNVLPVTAAAN
jgi:uncharacterized membrane protein YkoI